MNTFSSRLALSVIVVSFNMEREIPRTVYSLSAKMQQSMLKDEYEVIVVDNGSSNPHYLEDLKTLDVNLKVLRVENPTVWGRRCIRS